MRHRHRMIIVAAGILAATGVESVSAGSRNMGLGGAVIAVPDPSLVGRDNPAVLGVVSGRGLRMAIFDADVAVGNGSFSFADYRRYNGAELTETDEAEILSRVGDGGLEFGGAVSGQGPSIGIGPFALAVRGVGSGGGRVPREVLELLFNGNALGETVDVSATTGSGWAGLEVSAGAGWSLGSHFFPGETVVGAKLRYVHGFYHAGIRHAEGVLVTATDSLYGGGAVELATSSGGAGYALDLGGLHHMGDWNFGARLEGLVSAMRWDDETEVTRYEASAGIGDPFAEGTEFGDLVSTSDSTFAVSSFDMRLPLRVGVGASHNRGSWLFAGDLEHTPLGLVVGEDPWRLSAGAERMWFGRLLRTRAGLMFGGIGGTSLSGGLSVVTGPWRLDLDAGSYKTLNPFSPKGARFALGTALVIG